jgi:hypothetical protein
MCRLQKGPPIIEAKRFIVFDVIERWFRFIFFPIVALDNLDKDIGGLFLLILHNSLGG